MFLAFGIMAALWERERSGRGQVVDAAIVDGVSSLMAMFSGLISSAGVNERGESLLGGDAPFYRCYRCADGLDIAVGSLEPRFYADLLEKIGAPSSFLDSQYETANWPVRAEQLSRLFATKTRPQWCELLESTDACFAPVLSIAEAQQHPHMRSRQTYFEVDGQVHAAPAPRLSRTPGQVARTGSGLEALRKWGINP
jgi:alpha-methylacyl-CoA racemase